jgi:hypothetical protein
MDGPVMATDNELLSAFEAFQAAARKLKSLQDNRDEMQVRLDDIRAQIVVAKDDLDAKRGTLKAIAS